MSNLSFKDGEIDKMRKKTAIGSFVLLVIIGIAGIYYHDKGISEKELALINHYYQSIHIDAPHWVKVQEEWDAYPADVQNKFLNNRNAKAIFQIFETNRKACGKAFLFRSSDNENKFQKLVNEDLKIWVLILSKT